MNPSSFSRNGIKPNNKFKLIDNEYISTQYDSETKREWWRRREKQTSESVTLISGSDDSTIKIWSLKTGKCIKTLESHTRSVRCLILMAEKEQIISGSEDNTIKIWCLKTGACLRTLHGHVNFVRCLILLPNDILVSSSGSIIKMWSLNEDFFTNGYDDALKTLSTSGRNITSMFYLADTCQLVACGMGMIKKWNLNDFTVGQFHGHTHNVTSMVYLSDKRELVTASIDSTLRVWNFHTCECVKVLEGHTSGVLRVISLPENGLASGSYDGVIKVWSLTETKCVHTLKGHTKAVRYLVHLPVTNELASGSWDQCIRIWCLKTGLCVKKMLMHDDEIKGLILLPDGRLCSCSEDNTIKIWSMQSNNVETLGEHEKCVNCLVLLN